MTLKKHNVKQLTKKSAVLHLFIFYKNK